MTRQFDFALVPPSMDTEKSCYQLRLQAIQQFSIDSDTPLGEVLKMPYWFISDYYASGAWNIKKEHNANRDQITLNVLQQLANTQINLRNIQVLLGNMR